jgi:uncharacterized caspase-like protein
MRRLVSTVLTVLFIVSAFTVQALAEKRVALVIGNSAYSHVPKLPNPANDAEAMSILLNNAGFEVIQTRNDLDVNEMRRVVRDFSDTARDADIAVVFFAGHGIEVDGTNYLVPVDASLARDIDVEDETVSLERVLKVLEPAKRLRLVMLDACRENPFTKAMTRTIASRSVGRGLARVEPTTSDTLIAFAAKAGSIAADGAGIHSPFTAALLQHIATPGLDVRIAFGRVRDEVLKTTRRKQEPFVYGSLGGSTITLVSLAAGPTHGEQPVTQPSAAEKSETTSAAQAWRDYEAAANVGTKESWIAFLRKYPTGFHADLARAQHAKLSSSTPTAISAPKAILSPSESKRNSKNDARKRHKDILRENIKVNPTTQLGCCLQYMRRIRDSGGGAANCRLNVSRGNNYCFALKSLSRK